MGEENDKSQSSKFNPEEKLDQLEQEVKREQVEKEAKEREIKQDGEEVERAAALTMDHLKGRVQLDQEQANKINEAVFKSIKRIKEVEQKKVTPKSKEGKIIFEKIISTHLDQVLVSDPYASLKIYELLEKALLKDQLTLEDLELHYLKLKDSPVSDRFLRQWREILIDTAVDMGHKKEEVEAKFEIEESKKKENGYESQTSKYLEEKLNDKQRAFYRALSSPEDFKKYLESIRAEIAPEVIKLELPINEQEAKIAEKVNQHINNTIASIIFDIYAVASHHQNEPFEHIEGHGPFMLTPKDFYLDFNLKIEHLTKRIADSKESVFGHGFKVAIPERIKRTGVTVGDGENKEILPDFEEVTGRFKYIDIGDKHNLEEFIERIHNFVLSEKKRLEFGHNMRYLSKSALTNNKIMEEGFFKTLSGFASQISTSDIDEMFFDPEVGDLIQQALYLYETRLEQEMMANNWLKKPELAMSHFQNLANYEKYLIEEFKKRRPELEEWQILRVLSNAQIMFLGMNYELVHYFSYADPGRAPFGGGLDITDAGELMLSFYDPGMMQKRFQDPSMTGNGADWMPINISVYPFNHTDWTKWQAAFNESIEHGRAAYFKLTPDEWRRVRLGVDPGNVSKAGGYLTLQTSTWRIFNAYKYWLGENYNLAKDGLDMGKLKTKNDVLVESWKRLENLGIDILENFFIYKYKFTDLTVQEGSKFKIDEAKRSNVLKLFEHFYDRYFSQQISGVDLKNIFLPKGVDSKEKFIKYLESHLNTRDFAPSEIDQFFKERFYDVFTIMILERAPTKILTLEKKRLTQNGVRLYDEVAFDYYQHYSSHYGSLEEEKLNKNFRTSISDVSYVESQLRLEANSKMRQLRDKKGNLYGDLEATRSQVDYYITEDKIERILRNYFKDIHISPDEIEKRIQMAKFTYKKIIERSAQIPKKAKWEQDIEVKRKELRELKRNIFKNRKKIKALEEELGAYAKYDHREEFVTRLQWFSKMMVDDDFGFSFTSGDTANGFLNFSANGLSLLSRLAGFNADTAEALYKNWMLSNKWDKDRANFNLGETYKTIDEVFLKARGQWGTGVMASSQAWMLAKRTFNYFRKDEEMYGDFWKTWNRLFGKDPERSSSFAQDAAGGPRVGTVYEWGLNEMDKIVHEMIGGRGTQYFGFKTGEKDKKYKRIPLKRSFLGRIAERIIDEKKITQWSKQENWFGKTIGKGLEFVLRKTGFIPGQRYQKVRDFANEISGEALKKMHKYQGGFFGKEILPKLMLTLLIIALILAFKSAKDDFQVGSGKK
ncbi:MAG: hypothetical protein Fur009_4080 [Candidatus Microgenomates bacterium]